MANERIYTTGKLQDRQIISLFDELNGAFEEECRVIYGFANTDVEADTLKAAIGDGKSGIIQRATLNGPGNRIVVHFRRDVTSSDQPDGNININRRVPSPYLDEVIIAPPKNQQPSIEEIAKLDAVITKHTSVKLPMSADGSVDGIVDVLHKEVSELAAFHKKMLEDTENQRRELDEAFHRNQQEIEARAEHQREELRQQTEAENANLATLREELEEKKKALDDRDHMHVRRELREKISDNIEQRVSKSLLPAKIGMVSWAIVVLTFFAAAFAGYVAYGSYDAFVLLLQPAPPEGFKETPSNWLMISLAIRGIVASIVAIGFVIYALSWMRKTYLDNVRATHDLQRYALDINRASWTIETIMEMTTKEGRVLPDKWIEGACYGLFRDAGENKAEISPLEAWSALLSVSGKLRHGPDGTTIEVDKKGTRTLSKEGDAG